MNNHFGTPGVKIDAPRVSKRTSKVQRKKAKIAKIAKIAKVAANVPRGRVCTQSQKLSKSAPTPSLVSVTITRRTS